MYKGCRGKGPPRPFEGLASKEIRCLWTQTEISFSVELCRNWVTVVTRLRPCSVLIPDILCCLFICKKKLPFTNTHIFYFTTLRSLMTGLDGHKTFKNEFLPFQKKKTIFPPDKVWNCPLKPDYVFNFAFNQNTGRCLIRKCLEMSPFVQLLYPPLLMIYLQVHYDTLLFFFSPLHV